MNGEMTAKLAYLQHGRKRRKVSHRNSDSVRPSRRDSATIHRPSSPLGLSTIPLPTHDEPDSFEDIIEPLFPDLMEAAAIAQVEQIKYDETVSTNLNARTL